LRVGKYHILFRFQIGIEVVDVRFVNPVLETIVNVLVQMASMQPEAGKPYIKQDQKALGVVTGIIDLVSKQATGSIAISFGGPLAFELVKRMLRAEVSEVDDMVEDLVGELANIVAGGAKGKLEEQGFDFQLSLPRVVSGEGHMVEHKQKAPTVVLPFSSDAGEFFVEICF
jgi:chemotaxis protein CheX